MKIKKWKSKFVNLVNLIDFVLKVIVKKMHRLITLENPEDYIAEHIVKKV